MGRMDTIASLVRTVPGGEPAFRLRFVLQFAVRVVFVTVALTWILGYSLTECDMLVEELNDLESRKGECYGTCVAYQYQLSSSQEHPTRRRLTKGRRP